VHLCQNSICENMKVGQILHSFITAVAPDTIFSNTYVCGNLNPCVAANPKPSADSLEEHAVEMECIKLVD